MIVPLVDEARWRERLDTLPSWQPPSKSTLILSPHPDDETLGAGGLIARLRSQNVDVAIVAVTDGENAYTDGVDIRQVREQEQTAALARLGVPADAIHRFRMTDSGVSRQEDQLVQRLLPLITAKTHVITPWRQDFHPDHEACGRAAAKAAIAKGAQLTSYFFWTWHRGTLALLESLPLVAFPLSESEMTAKHDALLCHQSQLHHASGQPVLPESLLFPAFRPFEVYLTS